MNQARPKVLIEQWLPITEIGAECMRERGASSALPPLYFLHVWWARRPLTVSRAAILASLLPAYPTDDDDNVRPWPAKFFKQFPTFSDYKAWFNRLVGIHGDPVKSKKIIEWAKTNGVKLTPEVIRKLPNEWRIGLPNDIGVSIPYGYPRAFTRNPDQQQLNSLFELLRWTWGTEDITFCDPMSGGGSIPFEALRFGLTVHANELNPVASVILKATLDYPARFGTSLSDDIRKYGSIWCKEIRKRLETYYPLVESKENIFAYLWARTVACPVTGNPVPLSPNWWLRKGTEPVAVRLIADPKTNRCRYELVEGKTACTKARPDQGTIKHGTGLSPWTGEAIDGDYIKAEAQAGRMGHDLYALGIKMSGSLSFRSPANADEAAICRASKELERHRSDWERGGWMPTEDIGEYSNYDRGHRLYGINTWQEFFSPRQLLAFATAVESLNEVRQDAAREMADSERCAAVFTFLAIALDKALDYNCVQTIWHASRTVVAHKFNKHNYTFQWSYVEFDAARNLFTWAVEQVLAAYSGIASLTFPAMSMFDDLANTPVKRLRLRRGTAQNLENISSGSIREVCVDPPYYDNVQYAECSDFFYVWLKRSLGGLQSLGDDPLTPKDEEAVANPARFAHSGKKKSVLAEKDYENKMMASFREMCRILHEDGVLTVMFTHKKIEAWDTLGSALINAGFRIDASWPVHTENEHSLHQAKKNAAASTILLICRKREKVLEPVWWDDLKKRVKNTARAKAAEFEAQGIKGVDLYISTFGPVLSIISENWPVLTSDTDPKTGDPLPLKPGEALDLARQEVVNLRKQGLLLGRSVEFDPVTDWYLMAWDAFKAQEFPADEARKLALALGLDLEQNLVKEKRLVTKKSSSVVLSLPSARRKKGMVDEDAVTFPHLIDALHTAMMVYDEEGSKACQVFVDRQGLRTDSRTKALVQAMLEAIPTTRDKAGKFLRPEMTTLDALRMLFWDDLPAPKEEEPPKLDPQMKLAGFDDKDVDEDGDEEEDAEDEAE